MKLNLFKGYIIKKFLKWLHYIITFSSTDLSIDVEAEFQHDLKMKKRKRRKHKTNLSINQRKRKKYKISYGDTVKIKKCDSDDIIELEESTCAEIHDVKEHVMKVERFEKVSKKLEAGDDISEIEIEDENTSELNTNSQPDGDSVSYLA